MRLGSRAIPMTNEQRNNDITKLLHEFLERMNITAEIGRVELMESPCFQIKTPDSSILLGENGQNLIALHLLVKRIAERRFPEDAAPFLLDINDYQLHRIEEIKERARMSAQRVRYFKKEVVMHPMSAYERRIVHVALAEDPDVRTESIGEGEARRVAIRPTDIPIPNPQLL